AGPGDGAHRPAGLRRRPAVHAAVVLGRRVQLSDTAVLDVHQRELYARLLALRRDLRRPAGVDPAADRRLPDPPGLPRYLLLLPQGGLPRDPAEPDAVLRRGPGSPLPRREPVLPLHELAPVLFL